MELCVDGTLADYLASRSHINYPECVDICRQIIQGLIYIHDCSLIHRDLKPQNIFLTRSTFNCGSQANSSLSDFGSSYSISPHSNSYVSGPYPHASSPLTPYPYPWHGHDAAVVEMDQVPETTPTPPQIPRSSSTFTCTAPATAEVCANNAREPLCTRSGNLDKSQTTASPVVDGGTPSISTSLSHSPRCPRSLLHEEVQAHSQPHPCTPEQPSSFLPPPPISLPISVLKPCNLAENMSSNDTSSLPSHSPLPPHVCSSPLSSSQPRSIPPSSFPPSAPTHLHSHFHPHLSHFQPHHKRSSSTGYGGLGGGESSYLRVMIGDFGLVTEQKAKNKRSCLSPHTSDVSVPQPMPFGPAVPASSNHEDWNGNMRGKKREHDTGEKTIFKHEEESESDLDSSENNGSEEWEEESLHTAGLGTATYAAPEMLNSHHYDTAADLYSLGIVIYELFSMFGSAMERAECLRNLRLSGIVRKELKTQFPDIASLVLQLCSAHPKQRPIALDLLRHPMFAVVPLLFRVPTPQHEMVENTPQHPDEHPMLPSTSPSSDVAMLTTELFVRDQRIAELERRLHVLELQSNTSLPPSTTTTTTVTHSKISHAPVTTNRPSSPSQETDNQQFSSITPFQFNRN
eukprot:GCRY01006735.1.p1 GENE.GCRY01006735.1~~GCRY01006735.1.p1  ORF type:complete len:628 (-),score=76.51 GCRY01006735.1:243-2126(-)